MKRLHRFKTSYGVDDPVFNKKLKQIAESDKLAKLGLATELEETGFVGDLATELEETEDESKVAYVAEDTYEGESWDATMKVVILEMYAPEDMDLDVLARERWHTQDVTEAQINTAFERRFPPHSIRRDSTQPNGVAVSGPKRVSELLAAKYQEIKAKAEFEVCQETMYRRRITRCFEGEVGLKAVIDPEREVLATIHNLLGKKATELSANGSSTYAEIRKNDMTQLSDLMRKHKCITSSNDVIADFGSGACTALFHMCHSLSCRGIGVEYDGNRSYVAASYLRSLLKKLGTNPKLNPNVVAFHANIFDLNEIPYCVKVLYLYDEAYPPDLMKHTAGLIKGAMNLGWVVSFKSGKHHEYAGYLEVNADLEFVEQLVCRKQGSGESSRASLYRCKPRHAWNRRLVPHATTKAMEDMAAYYFGAPLPDQIDYYKRLATDIRKQLDQARVRSKHKSCVGPANWTECPRGCMTCKRFFQHMPRRELDFHEVEWLEGELGLYTRVRIQPHTLIVMVLGNILKNKPKEDNQRYVVQCGTRYIDAEGCGIQQYVNHSCAPNCAIKKWTNHHVREIISIVALKAIPADNELSVDYGKDRESFACKCNKCQ
jgi:hypothetical protein